MTSMAVWSTYPQTFKKQECIPVGCVPPAHWPWYVCWGVCSWGGGVCSWGEGLLLGGVCSWGGSALGGVSALQGGVCSWGGVNMWPVPSCIWCYLYAASTPTETHQQCSCLYTAGWSCDLQGMLGYHPPLFTKFLTNAYENITLPQTSLAGGKNCRE